MRLGQVEQFLHALAEAHAKPLAAADSNERLRELESGVVRIGPRIQKRLQSADAITGAHGQPAKARRREERHRDHVTQPGPADEEDAEAGDKKHTGRTEIGLDQQQAAGTAKQSERFGEPHEGAAQFFLFACRVTRDVDEYQHPGELGHLEVHGGDPQPAAAAVHRVSESGNQNEE